MSIKLAPVSNSVIYFLMFPFFLSLSLFSLHCVNQVYQHKLDNEPISKYWVKSCITFLSSGDKKRDYNDKTQVKTDLVTVEGQQY